ncbi:MULTISPECIES: signal peptidase II [Paenibacillus]|uniref:Lipoprotein signal peptidase n=1 Tax=Paenibacillus albilobatus TaxID=2716884 RepID=A0A920C7R4_9BACL|nr:MULTISPECIES: signal peptidase II [Paenibacillus]GIO29125.1 lipoprotein signal peptidase [Paenibacillus albilobatus]
MAFYMLALIVLLIDQGSKWWIRVHMFVGEQRNVLAPYLHFEYYQNSGAAFSSFQGYGKWFAYLAVVVVAALIYYRVNGAIRGWVLELAAGFIAGGALGNALDRLIFGKVTDFIVWGSGSGIMNIADLAINAGVILLIVGMLIRSWQDKRSYSFK